MTMAMTPLEEARYALDFGVARSDLGMAAQLEYDRLVGEGYGRPMDERPLTREELKQAKQERLEEFRRKRQESQDRTAATTCLPNLGVAVYEGNVYQHGTNRSGMASDLQASSERKLGTDLKLLGRLAGAYAEAGGDTVFLNAAGMVERVTINERIEAGRREFGGPAASGIPDMECPGA